MGGKRVAILFADADLLDDQVAPLVVVLHLLPEAVIAVVVIVEGDLRMAPAVAMMAVTPAMAAAEIEADGKAAGLQGAAKESAATVATTAESMILRMNILLVGLVGGAISIR